MSIARDHIYLTVLFEILKVAELLVFINFGNCIRPISDRAVRTPTIVCAFMKIKVSPPSDADARMILRMKHSV